MTDDNETSAVVQWFEDNGLTGPQFRQNLCLYFGVMAVGFCIGIIFMARSIQTEAAVTFGAIGSNTVEYHIHHSDLQAITQHYLTVGMVVFAPMLLYAAWIERRGESE